MNGITPAKSRLLAVALLVVLVLFFMLIVIKPVVAHIIETQNAISELEHEIEVYQRVAATLPEDEAHLEQMRLNNPVKDLHFQEERRSLASAALQQHLNRIVGRSGGQVVSTQIVQKTEDTPLPPVAISVHLRCEVPELVELLHSLESGKPLLFINNLVIASTNVRSRQVNTSSRVRRNTVRQRTPVAELDVRFELIGYGTKEGD